LLKKHDKIDEDINLAADRILDDNDLKKIKILKLKEGVKHVDRHGFRGKEDERAALAEGRRKDELLCIRDEYLDKM
jgi:hypothetical protein